MHETYCFFFVYVYGVIYTGDIYGVNYAGNNVNQIEKNPGLFIISSLILSSPYFYKRTGNLVRGNLEIKLALTCEG